MNQMLKFTAAGEGVTLVGLGLEPENIRRNNPMQTDETDWRVRRSRERPAPDKDDDDDDKV